MSYKYHERLKFNRYWWEIVADGVRSFWKWLVRI